jgi:hypothetical protein
MQVRKVVTGHDAKGRAVIARDEQIDGVPISVPATVAASSSEPTAVKLRPKRT